MAVYKKTYLLLGRTQTGKSTLCNYITETNAFAVGHTPVSTTKKAQTDPECEIEENGKKYRIRVVDTRGLFDTDSSLTPDQLIAETIEAICRECDYLNGVLIIAREDALTQDSIKTLMTVKSILQPRIEGDIPYILVFTYMNPVDYTEEQIAAKLNAFRSFKNKELARFRKEVAGDRENDVIYVNLANARGALNLRDGLLGTNSKKHKSELFKGMKTASEVDQKYRFLPRPSLSNWSCIIS